MKEGDLQVLISRLIEWAHDNPGFEPRVVEDDLSLIYDLVQRRRRPGESADTCARRLLYTEGLRRFKGVRKDAAKDLGVTPPTVWRWTQAHPDVAAFLRSPFRGGRGLARRETIEA